MLRHVTALANRATQFRFFAEGRSWPWLQQAIFWQTKKAVKRFTSSWYLTLRELALSRIPLSSRYEPD